METKQTSHPHYGEIIYDTNGLLVCHICGKGGFRALGHHVRQAHKDEVENMIAYKKLYGLDVKRGILIEETRLVKARKTKANGTMSNLMGEHSIEHRFKKGDAGRTKDKISEQTKRRMANRNKEQGRQ